MALPKIYVKSLAHIHYQHPDVEKALSFLLDFGLIEAHREKDRVYLRGYGDQPYLYILEQSPDDKRHFIGAYYVAQSPDELSKAATHPGATAVSDNEGPGGGKVVRLKDPHGFVVGFVYGQTLWTTEAKSLQLERDDSNATSNTATEKLRKGSFRRFRVGPSPVHKLGHYGISVPKDTYEATMKWYTTTLNLKGTDAIYDPATGKELTCFTHIDLGSEYSDHHSFFCGASASAKVAHAHHSSFEVNDFDTQVLGHDWLRSKGWTNCWGLGRHVLGSQIFDYWFDASGNVIEHYSDGDLVNNDSPFQREPAGPESLYVWGPNLPLAFMSGKLEDVGKTIQRPPDVVAAKPAEYNSLPQIAA